LLRDTIVIGTNQSAAWAILLFWLGYGALSLLAMLVECWAPHRAIRRDRAGLAVGLSLVVMVALIGSIG
jgi:hypothetical protein